MTMSEEEKLDNTPEEEAQEAEAETNQEPGTDELNKKLEEMNDKYLRLMAEYDNYRKRTTKEKIESYGNATAKCVSDILPVIDSFELALKTECADEAFKNGMQMIYTQFGEALKKLGVTEMEALGCEFNPNLHNAIKQTEDESLGENIVCEVFQKGYMLNDKVIRHAVVAVAN
jgi:molecular chaperone GrpE